MVPIRIPERTPPVGEAPRQPDFPEPKLGGTPDAKPSLINAVTIPEFKPMSASPTPQTTAGNTGGRQSTPAALSLMDSQTTWNPTIGKVSDDETVQAQLTKLLGSNSAYVDQARQRAIQLANARGLQNSTLAGMAGEEAAISQGLPIAQQDAATFLNQSQRNQQFSNAAGSQNAQMGFSKQQLGEQARQFDNDENLKRQSLLEQARQFDTQTTEQQRQFDNTAQLENRKLSEQQRQFDNQQLAQLSMFNRETASREQIAQLDASTKAYLAKVEAQYKNEMQSSASAAEMWKQYQDAVARILGNKDLDQANKQAALDILGKNLQEGMAVIGHIANLDLKNLLTFTGGSGGGGSGGGGSGGEGGSGGGSGGPRVPTNGDIDSIYRDVLGRSVDPSGETIWLNRLRTIEGTGLSRQQALQQIRQEIASSPEAQARGGGGGDPMTNPGVSPGSGYQWDPYRRRWVYVGGGGEGGEGGEGGGGTGGGDGGPGE